MSAFANQCVVGVGLQSVVILVEMILTGSDGVDREMLTVQEVEEWFEPIDPGQSLRQVIAPICGREYVDLKFVRCQAEASGIEEDELNCLVLTATE